MRRLAIALLMLLCASGGVMAACPPEAPGNTAAEIAANQARIVCLQNELAAESRQRELEFQIRANERRLQDLQLQQRIDALPKFTPPPIYVPPVVVVAPSV